MLKFADLKLSIESLLFASETPLEISEIRNILGEVSLTDIRLALRDLSHDYEIRAFTLFENNGKYQLRTKQEYTSIVRKLFQSKPRALSRSSLETLAIIAYKQPITRTEVNSIRNVDSSSIIAALKEKELIEVSGTRKEVGSPLEYKTTNHFLDIFGLKSLKDLPRLRSLQIDKNAENSISTALSSIANPPPENEESDILAFSSEQ